MSLIALDALKGLLKWDWGLLRNRSSTCGRCVSGWCRSAIAGVHPGIFVMASDSELETWPLEEKKTFKTATEWCGA